MIAQAADGTDSGLGGKRHRAGDGQSRLADGGQDSIDVSYVNDYGPVGDLQTWCL